MHVTHGSPPSQEKLDAAAKQLDRLAERLQSVVRPGHCDYISKADAAVVAHEVAADIRTTKAEAAPHELLAELRSLAESMERIVTLAQGDENNAAEDISRTQVSMWAASARAAIYKAEGGVK